MMLRKQIVQPWEEWVDKEENMGRKDSKNIHEKKNPHDNAGFLVIF